MIFLNVKLDTRMIDTLLRDISDSIDAEMIPTQSSVNRARLEFAL
jgi:hypothetical protein